MGKDTGSDLVSHSLGIAPSEYEVLIFPIGGREFHREDLRLLNTNK